MRATLPRRRSDPPGDPPDSQATRRQAAVDGVVPERSPAGAAFVLAAACLCQLMVVLDISVVNVALPDIGS
jgi:hypothetical protein